MLMNKLFELDYIVTSVGIDASIKLIKRLVFIKSLLIEFLSSILTVKSRYDAFFYILKSNVSNSTLFNTRISDV
ncbi:uncharacterized protein A1O5_00660 [Cladophialophora psammophila CBS 110553]|uniref:Uncharacterized protein n=1 Tax=Cladophialophora psammophila CBS 110553 TaxID=1182543 RepID=W9X6P2_9EURO|nr:uncharacterized protein A1O5_00660 [Cladophialophora psammophila CBS 110553]EXJ76152.1 hypothetical protein A1O5_00660 [Cladophialophora psammophila CBS 110553]